MELLIVSPLEARNGRSHLTIARSHLTDLRSHLTGGRSRLSVSPLLRRVLSAAVALSTEV